MAYNILCCWHYLKAINLYNPLFWFLRSLCYLSWQFKRSITVMCLCIGTPKIINFPFVPNGKLINLGVPKFGNITAPNYNVLKYWDTLKPPFFHLVRVEELGVPILKHFRVNRSAQLAVAMSHKNQASSEGNIRENNCVSVCNKTNWHLQTKTATQTTATKRILGQMIFLYGIINPYVKTGSNWPKG